jgi:hypothetical protein
MEKTEPKKSKLNYRLILRSLKWPILYFIIGIAFLSSVILENFSRFNAWKPLLDWGNKIGNIFITIGLITFFYKLFKYYCLYYEKLFEKTNPTYSLIISTIRKNI